MNPIFQMIVGALFHLKRKCPKCKREQVIPMSQKDKTINCKFCGFKIPPKK